MGAKSLQSCSTLCNPMDRSSPGSSNHGIFQASILEWVAISFSNHIHSFLIIIIIITGFTLVRAQSTFCVLESPSLFLSDVSPPPTRGNLHPNFYAQHCLSLYGFTNYVKVNITQSCPTLCNSVDYTVHGILQARILEWVAFPFSRGSS